MARLRLLGEIVVTMVVSVTFLAGCGQSPEPTQSRSDSAQSSKATAQQAMADRALRKAQATKPTPTPTPTPEPEKLVTLTTTTTLRELAAELTKQLGIEYAADDAVADTTISLDLRNATRGDVETAVREKTKVRLIYSDRDIPEKWVHFAPEF
ncbi:MAG: hypothetical protein ACP5QZ_00080 [Candidatus Sumerlaeaceae bacterium]|jgi:hypothetical protein